MNDNTQAHLNLDVTKLPTMRCIRCGGFTFNDAYVIKKVSAIVSPSGKETAAPIQIFTCANCGTILPLGSGDNLDYISDIRDEQTSEVPNKIITI